MNTEIKKYNQFKVTCIVRLKSGKYLKYHVTNLLKFTAFLDSVHKNWLWYNVYDPATFRQVTSFTKYNRPTASKLS